MSIATKCTCHMSSNGFCNSSVKQCTKLIKMEEKKYPIVGYAPGNYHCRCGTCERSFFGDKRAYQCEPCAIATKEKFDALSPEEQKELMESNAKAIREAFSIGGKKCNCNQPYDSDEHEGGYPRCPVHDKAIEIPRQMGAPLPTDEQVSTWFEENIDKGCSASSAIYKFRQWLKSLPAEPKPGPVWVKASDRLPGYEIPVKWRDGNDHAHATNGKIPLIHMAKPFLTGWEWYDESAPSGERELTDDIKQALAAFIKVARHIRNYPHPQLTIELLRSEAVLAEMKGERILGKDVYDRISELAFKGE